MTLASPIVIATWLALSLVLAAYAWLGRRAWLALPIATIAAAAALWPATGTPRYTAPPPGRYVVLGVDIEVGVAIRVLLKGNGAATYYSFPYTEGKASELQAAIDIGAQGGSVTMVEGEGGGEFYDGEPPVTGDNDKRAEQPAVEVE